MSVQRPDYLSSLRGGFGDSSKRYAADEISVLATGKLEMTVQECLVEKMVCRPPLDCLVQLGQLNEADVSAEVGWPQIISRHHEQERRVKRINPVLLHDTFRLGS